MRLKPAKERTLELMKSVYSEYWDTKFKGMEQPKESDGNFVLCANGVKKGDNKNRNGI